MSTLPRGSARRCTLWAALACALCLPASASAAPTVTLKAGLRPEQLGAGTTIKFAFSIAYGNETPSPLTVMELSYPANLGIGTSDLGLTTCRAALLVVNGPPGCPSTSVMGDGTGLVEVPFGEGTVYEGVRLTTFMAPLQAGHLGLLFYAVAPGPISAEIIFHSVVLLSDNHAQIQRRLLSSRLEETFDVNVESLQVPPRLLKLETAAEKRIVIHDCARASSIALFRY
jgi:hypothetical protein